MSTHGKNALADSEDDQVPQIDDSTSKQSFDAKSVECTPNLYVATHDSILQEVSTLRDISAPKRQKILKGLTSMMEDFAYMSRAATAMILSNEAGPSNFLPSSDLATKVDRIARVVDVIDKNYAYLMGEINKTYSSVVSVGNTSAFTLSTLTSLKTMSKPEESYTSTFPNKTDPSKTNSILIYPSTSNSKIKSSDDTKKVLLETLHPVRLGLCVDKLLIISIITKYQKME